MTPFQANEDAAFRDCSVNGASAGSDSYIDIIMQGKRICISCGGARGL